MARRTCTEAGYPPESGVVSDGLAVEIASPEVGLATGEIGSVDVTISVRPAPPKIVSIEPNAVSVVQPNWKGIPMVQLVPNGFSPNAWGWKPDLPRGITASGFKGGPMVIQGRAEDIRLAGPHTYTLTATDGMGATASATLTIVFEQ